MQQDLNFGPLENGPHIDLIRNMAERCYANTSIQAIWVGGSLASGTGDAHSDIDFRIAVDASEMDKWMQPDWNEYLPLESYGATLMRFGEHAILHHHILSDGTIIDFFVQATSRKNPEPALVVIACRNDEFGEALANFATPALSLTKDIHGETVRQFLVDYWILTHKEAKGLGRKYDYSGFVGLYHERLALLRALYMEHTGSDIEARATIHMLGILHKGLSNKLSEQQQALLGLPTTTVDETVVAIERIRSEVSRVGKLLSKNYNFEYPQELEDVVLKTWADNKEVLVKR